MCGGVRRRLLGARDLGQASDGDSEGERRREST
jgi:hypothetical protein